MIFFCNFMSMKHIFAILLISIAFSASGQNYLPVYSDRVQYFQASQVNNFQYGESGFGINESLVACKIDSMHFENGSEEYFFIPTARRQGQGTACSGPGFFGNKMVLKGADSAFFFNGENHTLLILPQSAPGAEWKLFTFSDNSFIQAEVGSIEKRTLLNVEDSVKIIALNYFAADGTPAQHPVNGKVMEISKNHGFVKTLDIYHFPDKLYEAQLAGSTSPEFGPTMLLSEDIFNFNVGDEFHYKGSHNAGPASYSSWRKRKAVSVEQVVDTLFVSWQETYVQKGYEEQYNQYFDGIKAEKYFLNTEKDQYQPYELRPSFGSGWGSIGFSEMIFRNGRWLVRESANYLEGTDNDCYSEMLASHYEKIEYAEGLGQINWSLTGYTDEYEQMVYYKKGNEEWGDSINFAVITSVTVQKITDISLYPNPAERAVNIKGHLGDVLVTIYNSQGETVMERMVHQSLNLENLSPGIYHCVIRKDQAILHSEKLIVN